MAKLIIKLVINAKTKKRDILVDYESDSAALPMEHEHDHKQLVDKLIEGGALKASEVGDIIVRRDTEQNHAARVEGGEIQSEGESLDNSQS